jgi:WD40 repeat protein
MSDKLRLLSAGQNGTVQMWDFTTGQKIGGLLQSEQGNINCICFSICGKLWVTGHENGNVCLWQGTDNVVAPLHHTLLCHKEGVTCVALALDNKNIVTGSRDDTVQVWNIKDYTRVAMFNLSGWLTEVAISPDGRHIAAASYDEMRIWNLHSPTTIREPILASPIDKQFSKWVDYMVFSPDGTILVTRKGYSIEIYDLSVRMRCFATFSLDHKYYRGEPKPYPTPTFSPDGKYLFCGSRAFDFAHMTKIGHRNALPPPPPPEALTLNPISPLFLMRKNAQIHSNRRDEPILLIPPDINVDRGPWVAFDNTIAFGSLDGRVFIIRFPTEYM